MKTVTISKGGKFTSDRYNDVVFLVSAINLEEDVREVWHYVYSNDGFLWATDGSRLHCIPADGIENGLYTFTKTAKEVVLIPAEDQEQKYPNYEQVFPFTNMVDKNISGKWLIEKTLTAYARFNSEFKEIYSLDINLLKPIFKASDTWTITMFKDSEYSPVMFQNCTKTALVMPIRIKN